MNTFPASFEERMKKQLQTEAPAFFAALQAEAPVSVRLNPGKAGSFSELFPEQLPVRRVEWCEQAYYLNQRPVFTLDPAFHGGAYYVQEASSMFFAHVLKQILPSAPVRALDLCAAPGGKSTLIASALPQNSLLVSNEVIRSRANILKENIIKWGQDNIVVTNNDPADFSPLEGAFDLVLVDAPCSGEGMFRKDSAAIGEWSENNVQLCSERQQRILSDIWKCVKPGGFLIYSTCTYNRNEDEQILEWLVREFDAQSIKIEHPYTGITPGDSSTYGYHFYPHKTAGEGFFIGVVQKTDGPEFSLRKNKKLKSNKIIPFPAAVLPFILTPERYAAYETEVATGLIPLMHSDFISHLGNSLRVIYQGCEIAEPNNRKVKLMPALALWQGLNKNNCTVYEADKTTALTFLKKEDIQVQRLEGDWILISYGQIGLGWCKNLGNRLNNYYPKEWRIRMAINE